MTSSRITTLRHSVLSAPTRHRLARVTSWHPGTVDVPLDRLLLGGQNGTSAAEFGLALGDPMWPSRRVIDGPHARLLERSRAHPLTDEEILASDYTRMAEASIRLTGRYFSATDTPGVVAVARQFLERAAGGEVVPAPGNHHTDADMPVLAQRVAESDCYQVLDGHHRIAARWAAGDKTLPVRVRRGTVTTPLQEMLREMSWLEGRPELYQPLAAPELEARWTTVRRCSDRLEKMWHLLDRLDVDPDHSDYLDVASCYGWFVARMDELGFDAHGVERDPLGPLVGLAGYGLDPERIEVGDAVAFLRESDHRWDVVSCFSLMHHFVIRDLGCEPEELVRLLDSVTGRVLFLDTGQGHERWFRKSLRGWDPERIRRFLSENTTFDRIVDLGPDSDAVPPYQDNYGRHLFACIRDR